MAGLFRDVHGVYVAFNPTFSKFSDRKLYVRFDMASHSQPSSATYLTIPTEVYIFDLLTNLSITPPPSREVRHDIAVRGSPSITRAESKIHTKDFRSQ